MNRPPVISFLLILPTLASCSGRLGINPYDGRTHSALGNVYLFLNDRKAAMEEYDILIGIDASQAERLLIQINKNRQ